MSAKLTVGGILQCVHIWNHYVAHRKLTTCFISIKRGGGGRKGWSGQASISYVNPPSLNDTRWVSPIYPLKRLFGILLSSSTPELVALAKSFTSLHRSSSNCGPPLESCLFGSQWRAGFLNSCTVDISSEVILCCGVGPVHCRMFLWHPWLLPSR